MNLQAVAERAGSPAYPIRFSAADRLSERRQRRRVWRILGGAGRGVHSMVLFTLGTGVGGGIIIGDRVMEGRHSHGGEVGHIKIEMTNPRLCGCGRRGCLEAYASATAVVKRTREALAEAGACRSALLRTPTRN